MIRRTSLLFALTLAGPAFADGTGTFTLGATSGYVWRGIAQTDRDIVYQAEARYEDKSGFYVGAFGTPVDRVVYPLPGAADLRADFFGGIRAKTPGGLGWDIGLNIVRFDESGLAFEEAYLGLLYGEWRAQVAHDWGNDNTYYRLGGEFDLGSEVLLTLFGGHYNGDTINSYYDFGAGLSTLAAGWRIALDFTDTDIDPGSDATSSRTVLSVRRSW